MLQTAAASVRTRPQPETPNDDRLDPLLRLAGDLANVRALIVAEHGLDWICRLLRGGCLAATSLRPGGQPDAHDYDVVLIPRVAVLSSADDAVRLARRALALNGRLVAGVSEGRQAAALMRRLRLNGFAIQRLVHLPGLLLLRADPRRPS